MEHLDFVYSLTSPYLFGEAKANINDLEYYFSTEPATSGDPLVMGIINAIKNYDYDSFGDPLFQSIIGKCRYTNPGEPQKILDQIHKWQSYNKEAIKPAEKTLKDVIYGIAIQRANSKFGGRDAEAFVKYIKNLDIKFGGLDDHFGSTNFNDFDIQKILDQQSLGAIPTNYQWLNDVFPPHNGIERGQLGIISAPPGVGKSLFAMNLALYFASQGIKVLYVTLGDLVERDWIVRLGAIAYGVPFSEVYKNMKVVFHNLQTLSRGCLAVSINPSGVITADEIVEYALGHDFEVVFVDYDANHKGAADGTEGNGQSMYSSIGQIYSAYTKLSMSGKLVFMCSQPKIYAWNQLIGLSDIGESKRKQETADFIITISNTAPDCPNHLYTASIPKARRGKVGTKKYLIRIEGRFIEIPRSLYDQLATQTDEVQYTEQQIETMSREYRKQEQQIKAQINKQMQGPVPIQQKPGQQLINPFATNP